MFFTYLFCSSSFLIISLVLRGLFPNTPNLLKSNWFNVAFLCVVYILQIIMREDVPMLPFSDRCS